jgi:hypothetical protein
VSGQAHYHDVVTARQLARALATDAIPIVGRGARLTSSASATLLVAGGTLAVAGRAFVRAYGGSVHASGTATVLAEHSARVRADEDAVVILDGTFVGSVRVADNARCLLPRAATDVADFCRIHRIEVIDGLVAVAGDRDRARCYVGDVAWYRAFTGRRRPPTELVPLRELKLSGGGASLVTASGMSLLHKMTAARRAAPVPDSELRVDGTASRVVKGARRVSVGDRARLVARGSALVTAWGSAFVEATDDTTVIALDGARIVARGRAVVRAFDVSKVEAHDEAVVLASEYSRVVAHDASCIESELWAVVEAGDEVRVRAFEESTVHATDSARVQAAGNAIVHAASRTKVVAGPYVTLR